MFEEGTPKKHRHRTGYTVQIIPDDPDGKAGIYRIGHIGSQILAFTLFFIVVALCCLIVYGVLTILGLRDVNHFQSEQITALIADKDSLAQQNSELNAKVEQLSKSISQKVVKETYAEQEDAEKHLPTGSPLTGAAVMTATKDLEEADSIEEAMAQLAERTANGEDVSSIPGDPMLYFTETAEGSSIVATGDGKIAVIDKDKKYGNRVVVDHGNGYKSIYRNSGDPMMRVGDTVVRGSILYVITQGNTTVGYQITKDNEFIDPETITQIDG